MKEEESQIQLYVHLRPRRQVAHDQNRNCLRNPLNLLRNLSTLQNIPQVVGPLLILILRSNPILATLHMTQLV